MATVRRVAFLDDILVPPAPAAEVPRPAPVALSPAEPEPPHPVHPVHPEDPDPTGHEGKKN